MEADHARERTREATVTSWQGCFCVCTPDRVAQAAQCALAGWSLCARLIIEDPQVYQSQFMFSSSEHGGISMRSPRGPESNASMGLRLVHVCPVGTWGQGLGRNVSIGFELHKTQRQAASSRALAERHAAASLPTMSTPRGMGHVARFAWLTGLYANHIQRMAMDKSSRARSILVHECVQPSFLWRASYALIGAALLVAATAVAAWAFA